MKVKFSKKTNYREGVMITGVYCATNYHDVFATIYFVINSNIQLTDQCIYAGNSESDNRNLKDYSNVSHLQM